MSDQINDGGSAFPLGGSDDYSYPPQEGMTLRDYFAGQEEIHPDEHFGWELCEALAGKQPDGSDPVELFRWYARWQAGVKFLRAEAMIEARNGKEPS